MCRVCSTAILTVLCEITWRCRPDTQNLSRSLALPVSLPLSHSLSLPLSHSLSPSLALSLSPSLAPGAPVQTHGIEVQPIRPRPFLVHGFGWTVSIQEQLLRRNVKRFRGELVFGADKLVYHSTLGSRVKKNKTIESFGFRLQGFGVRVSGFLVRRQSLRGMFHHRDWVLRCAGVPC